MSRSVIRKEVSHQGVLNFEPPSFQIGSSAEALEYLNRKKNQPGFDFKMADSIRLQTGVAGHEEENIALRISNEVLAKLKEVQESAYKEAYQLGLDEGKHEAFQSFSKQISEQLEVFGSLISSLGKLKMELVSSNESSLMKLLVYMASRIAFHEVEINPDVILKVIRQATEMSQDEERVVVSVSEKEIEFIEQLKKESKKEFEFLKQVQLEASPNISAGGCVIETNYGVVDAQIEERVNKLWSTISEALPKSKTRVSVA